jgi:hypothetical protein
VGSGEEMRKKMSALMYVKGGGSLLSIATWQLMCDGPL